MRILHVDDHVLFRAALRLLLTESKPDVVVREATTADEVMAATAVGSFDLLLVDVDLGGSDGIALVRQLRERGVTTPVLMLSASREPDTMEQAIQAGANGYALKHGSSDELLAAIERAVEGRAPGETQRASDPTVPTIANLTRRERQVFDLLAQGHSARQIAGELAIGIKTVETHRERIFKKLGLHNIVQLVRFAARHQLLDLAM